ncbi:unnamed protein product, partial [Amoebophrya sp. A25]|eukprot:GSA25T00008252001.1
MKTRSCGLPGPSSTPWGKPEHDARIEFLGERSFSLELDRLYDCGGGEGETRGQSLALGVAPHNPPGGATASSWSTSSS